MKIKALTNFKYKSDTPEFIKGRVYEIILSDYSELKNNFLVEDYIEISDPAFENKKIDLHYEENFINKDLKKENNIKKPRKKHK